mmetsp:Transcript_63374/g.137962  ORF Transcript_63374/g.137962 Transcript_63374/m.137962 type:complete len:439 (-) Transcript_63374:19-1335(-)
MPGTAVQVHWRLPPVPDECWLRIFAYLEATELSAAAELCAVAPTLARQTKLWLDLLCGDFCTSFTQRALLRAWLTLHPFLHPRELYVFKRREHLLSLDMARADLRQRGEQAREQERKQRRLRLLNCILVRATNLLLCISLLATSILLWLRLDRVVPWGFYTIFAPLLAFEVFMLITCSIAMTIYCLRSSSGWTFYWNRLRGGIRWLILYTSPWEGAIILLLSCSVLPLLACALEGDALLPRPSPRFVLPFGMFWLASLSFFVSMARRGSFSASCVGTFALLGLPAVSLSVLLFLRLAAFPQMPAYVIFAPSIGVTCLLLIFVGFLVVASCWLGWRGNRDWTEYAAIMLLTMLSLLLPLLLFQLAILAHLNGRLSANGIFLPWLLWLLGLLAWAAWHACTPLALAPTVPIDHLTRPWRQPEREPQSDTELLLPPMTGFV